MSEVEGKTEDLDGTGLRIGIAVSTFNETVTDGLLEGARGSLASSGVTDVVVVHVPGAFELPLIAQRLARSGCDAVIALGAVIMGGTDHYDHVAHRCSEGLLRVSLDEGIPVTFGVLTTR
ncbi:MAG: 6,7-dimethyl-8-ribityllumazine synthase, partial [Acidimicrobiia bacterium]|nr:6,7-dimethyl-8-ribityllumazine synthase [Acidimicrobiia bacterium]